MNELKSSSDDFVDSSTIATTSYDFLTLSIRQQFEEFKKQKNNNNNNNNNDNEESITNNDNSDNSNNDDKINRTKLFSQIKELDKNSIMLIETYYRDKLITYQEKLKKELEFIYSKKLESLKDQYDKNSYLKLRELELWTKKSLLKLLIEFQDLKKQKQINHNSNINNIDNNIDNNNNNNNNNNIDNTNNHTNSMINNINNNLIIQKEEENILNKLEGLSKCVSELLLHQSDFNDQNSISIQSFLNTLNNNNNNNM